MKYFGVKTLVELAGIIMCKFDFGKKKHYDLAIIRVDGIGDYVMWHDTVSVYKEKYDGSTVVLICLNPTRKLAEQEDFFSEIISFDDKEMKRNPIYAFKFLRKLKEIKADIVINPMRERQWYADVFTLAIKSTNKVSIKPKELFGPFAKYYNKNYTTLIDCDNCISEIEADIKFTKDYFSRDYEYGHYALSVDVKCSIPKQPYAVVSFSTSSMRKNWSVRGFVEIINEVPENYRVILVGAGALDIEQAAIIIEGVNDKNRVDNFVDKTTVAEMVYIISKASFVIGNDSSAVHIAAAVHVPSIAIVAGACYGRFLPYPDSFNMVFAPRVVAYNMPCYNCNFKCIYEDQEPVECIKRITSDMVKDELTKLMEELKS